jgi:hypothetical protein
VLSRRRRRTDGSMHLAPPALAQLILVLYEIHAISWFGDELLDSVFRQTTIVRTAGMWRLRHVGGSLSDDALRSWKRDNR